MVRNPPIANLQTVSGYKPTRQQLLEMIRKYIIPTLLFVLYILSIIATLFLLTGGIFEIIDQVNGEFTLYNQTSSLTSKQIILFSVIWTSVFAFISVKIIKSIMINDRKNAIIFSVLTWVSLFLILYIDSLFRVTF